MRASGSARDNGIHDDSSFRKVDGKVLNLNDLRSDVLASGEDPAGGSSDVGSDVCVVPDPLLSAVSVRTVVAEEWMDWFVLDLVECPVCF